MPSIIGRNVDYRKREINIGVMAEPFLFRNSCLFFRALTALTVKSCLTVHLISVVKFGLNLRIMSSCGNPAADEDALMPRECFYCLYEGVFHSLRQGV